MRIWYIHPKYYDKKGILAQWNEGLILKNLIYGTRNQLTIEKEKKKKAKEKSTGDKDLLKKRSRAGGKKSPVKETVEPEKTKKKAWSNHPFSKRVTRYPMSVQKKLINTYLYNLREYGQKKYNIKFNDQYLDKDEIDHKLKVPIVLDQVERDHYDSIVKMEKRDKEVLEVVKKVKKTKDLELLPPFYLEKNYKKYEKSLSKEYLEWCGDSKRRKLGTELEHPDGDLKEILSKKI